MKRTCKELVLANVTQAAMTHVSSELKHVRPTEWHSVSLQSHRLSEVHYKMEDAWVTGSTNALGCCSDQWWDFIMLSPEVLDSVSQQSLFKFVLAPPPSGSALLPLLAIPSDTLAPHTALWWVTWDPFPVFRRQCLSAPLVPFHKISDGITTEMWTLFPIWPVCAFFLSMSPSPKIMPLTARECKGVANKSLHLVKEENGASDFHPTPKPVLLFSWLQESLYFGNTEIWNR